MVCLECGRQNNYKYEDEASKTLKQRLCAWIPSAARVGSFVNVISLAGIVYALKLLREDHESIEDIEEFIGVIFGENATDAYDS